MVLEGTSHYFEKLQRNRRERKDRLYEVATIGSPRSVVTSSVDGRSMRRGFGLAPWHRRNSHESLLSVSSSVHRLLMGKTPATTPRSEEKYFGPGGESFSKGTADTDSN